MQLDVLTPDKKVFSGEAVAVKLPGSEGSFEVLNNHAPIISTLDKGYISIRTGGEEKKFLVDGGIVEVLNNKIIVLAESVISE